MLALPGASLLSLVWTVAAWAIWQGIAEVLLSRRVASATLLGVGGAVSIVAGIVLIALPAILTPLEGGFSLVTAVALYGVVRGLYLLAAAGRGRRLAA
ncbi:MAG: hypothetical protein NVV74_00090 [Magnetospirillum sp.]|nr:hypothetical protein [Magnetospirillum sp.]